MADVHSPETRSFNMSRIRNKNTKPEMIVRKFLFANGFRYRLNDKRLPGKPDIVLKRYNTVILVNGCFWHGHPGCRFYSLPKTRTEWWENKINRNITNDSKKQDNLRSLGWKVTIVWECDLKAQERDSTLKKLIEEILNHDPNTLY